MSPELWDWKYIKNPSAPRDPEIIVAIDNNKIIGMIPLMFAEFWFGERKIKSVQACDVAVHPEYQRRGVFDNMNQFTVNYFASSDVNTFHYFPNNIALNGYLKKGWKIVATTNTFYIFCQPNKVFSYKLKNQTLGKIGAAGYGIIKKIKTNTISVDDNTKIIITDKYDDRLKVIDSFRNLVKIEFVRNEQNLKWRFDQHPEHIYKFVQIMKSGHLSGYAIISAQRLDNGLLQGLIVDYLVNNNDNNHLEALIQCCIDQLISLKVDFIALLAIGNTEVEKSVLQRHGFLSSTKFPMNLFGNNGYFVTRQAKKINLVELPIYDVNKWRITYIFQDTT